MQFQFYVDTTGTIESFKTEFKNRIYQPVISVIRTNIVVGFAPESSLSLQEYESKLNTVYQSWQTRSVSPVLQETSLWRRSLALCDVRHLHQCPIYTLHRFSHPGGQYRRAECH